MKELSLRRLNTEGLKMPGLEKLLPSLPSWLAIPIILLTILLTLGPQVAKVVTDFTTQSRAFRRENERLSLLKLRYEIEALRKEKGLDEIVGLPAIYKQGAPKEKPASEKELVFLKRFAYGAIGASIPPILGGLEIALTSDGQILGLGYQLALGYLVGMLVLGLFGGLMSALFLKKTSQPLLCFLTGLSLVLLLRSFISTSTSPTLPSGVAIEESKS